MPNLGDELFRLAGNVARAVPYFTQMADENDQILASQRTNALIRDWAKKAPELLTGNPDGWVDSMSQYLQTQRDALADGMTPGQIQHFSNMTDQWFTQETVRVGAARQNALQPYHLSQLQARGKDSAETIGQAPWAYDVVKENYRQEVNRNPWVDEQQRGALMAGFESDVGLYNAMSYLNENGVLQAKAAFNAGEFSRLGANREQFGKMLEEAEKDAIATNTTGAIEQFNPVHTNFWNAFNQSPDGNLRAQLAQARIAKDTTMANPLVSDEEKKRQSNEYEEMAKQVAAIEKAKMDGETGVPVNVRNDVALAMQEIRASWNNGADLRIGQARTRTLADSITALVTKYPNSEAWIRTEMNAKLQGEINFEQDPHYNVLLESVGSAVDSKLITPAQGESITASVWREIQQTMSAGGQTPFAVAFPSGAIEKKVNSLIYATNPSAAPESLRLMMQAHDPGFDRMDTNRGTTFADGGTWADANSISDREKMVNAMRNGELAAWQSFDATTKLNVERNYREMVLDFAQRAPENLVSGSAVEERIDSDGLAYAVVIPAMPHRPGVPTRWDESRARFFAPIIENGVERWYEYNPTTREKISTTPVQINRQRQTNRNIQVQRWDGK